MAYNDTPQAAQRISDTQPLIRSNFQQIQTAFSVNHVPIADGSGNQGKHNFITFPVQGVAPIPGAGEIDIWSQANAPQTAVNELFIKKQQVGGSAIPFTAIRVILGQGWTFLPSGLLMKFGSVNMGSNPLTVTFPNSNNEPTFGSIFAVIVTGQDASLNANLTLTNFAQTNFTVRATNFSAASTRIHYIAYGTL